MFPGQEVLSQIHQRILNSPNKRKESKRSEHYCCYLLCEKAGLRVSEAINLDLSAKTHKGLYRLNKTKGKKTRLACIPKQVISELKANNWQPNRTNRFNFYHFLKSIKKELGISQNVELTPHTLRRAFAAFNAEAGLPLPLLSKLLGHSSVRTTALYWINTYHPDDDDDNDVGVILAGKDWLEKQEPDEPESKLTIISEILPYLNHTKQLTENLRLSREINQSLQHQLNDKDKKITNLQRQLAQSKEQNADLRKDLSNLSQQNVTLHQELTQAKAKQEQILAEKDKTIAKLEQELVAEQSKRIDAENNLAQERQNNHTLQETNANLTQKLHTYEQNHTNLTNAYQNSLKAKQNTEISVQTEKQRANYYEQQLKSIAKVLQQWQKIHFYQQLEKQRSEMKAQIVQIERPPPWKPKKIT